MSTHTHTHAHTHTRARARAGLTVCKVTCILKLRNRNKRAEKKPNALEDGRDIKVWDFFYDHVTVHRNKFLCNKTN
jgi:hypothetical protein